MKRYMVQKLEVLGMAYEKDGSMQDAIELVLSIASASKPGELNAFHFVIPAERAEQLGNEILRIARAKDARILQPPPQKQ